MTLQGVDAKFVYGTKEYVIFEYENTNPGITFDPSDYTIKVAIAEDSGDVFDADTATWADATAFSAVINGITHYYIRCLMGDGASLDPTRDEYDAYIKFSSADPAIDEEPIILASGRVIFE